MCLKWMDEWQTVLTVAASVDPYDTPNAASELGLHCLLKPARLKFIKYILLSVMCLKLLDKWQTS